MITLSFDFEKGAKKAKRGTQEQEIRDIVDTHLAFPGSDKLKMGVNIKSNGATSVSFTGPKEAIAEARRLWRERVKPAAAKVKRTVAKVKRKVAPVKRKAARKTAPKTTRKVAKSAAARAQAAPARKTPKKRKS